MRRTICLLLAACLGACGDRPADLGEYSPVRVLDTPAASGSMAPNLVRGAGDTVALSWIEPHGEDHALRYSVFGDDQWSEPQTVVTGTHWFVNWADFPSVVPVSETLWAAHWLVRREAGGYAYDIAAAISVDGGVTWSGPFNPHTDNTDSEHGFVSMFPNDDGIGMIWLDGRKMVNEYDENDVAASGMTLRAATFDANLSVSGETLVDELICDCCQTDVAIASRGPVAVYRDRTTSEIRDISVARMIEGQWQAGTPLGNDNWNIPGCPVNGPVVQAHDDVVAVAWFSAANESPRVQAAFSNDSGASFGTAIEVSAESPTGHVASALLPDGRLAVAWHRGVEGAKAELVVRTVSATGALGEPMLVASRDEVFGFSVPQLVRDNDKLIVAWTNETDQRYSIESAVIPIAIFGN